MSKHGRNRLMVTAGLLAAVVVLGGLVSPAWADPQSLWVTYNLREDPQDPNSALLWSFSFELEEEDRAGDDVGWQVHSLWVVQYDEYEEPCAAWADENVHVPTQDGLWWVTHADADDPQTAEFDDLSAIDGTALLDFGGEEDLHYELDFDPHTWQSGDPEGVVLANLVGGLILPSCLYDPECVDWIIHHPTSAPSGIEIPPTGENPIG